LILGRVTSGPGGDIILKKAKEVLIKEFPELSHIEYVQPDEHMKRVGQAVAAASLPHIYESILRQKPGVAPPLEPEFRPWILGKRAYLKAVADEGSGLKVSCALRRQADLCYRFDIPVFPESHPNYRDSELYAARLIKFHLWSKGGRVLLMHGPQKICKSLAKWFDPLDEAARFHFDVGVMKKIYGTNFLTQVVEKITELPAEKNSTIQVNHTTEGCRLAFDLGKSDFKVVAVQDGEVVYSKETEWDIWQQDPTYHYHVILEGLQEAAKSMPRVDGIGGSTAGVPINNDCVWSDCFPNIPDNLYKKIVVPIFKNIAKEFGENTPLTVINDGEVTALAGMGMVGKPALFGISMGSNEGAGYVDRNGHVESWINELWAAPVDFNPTAPKCPWSGARGVGSMYFGQRAVEKLAPKAGFTFPAGMLPQHKLKEVQKAMAEGDQRAVPIYESIGVYLAYATAQYADFYDFDSFLILGRVTSGPGGEIILNKAREVVAAEFPELAHIVFVTPDEHMKRVGQAVAAAALPRITI